MYQFLYKEEVYCDNNFKFVHHLKERWDELHTKTNVFRYKLGKLKEKIVGNLYILQLNQDRGVKRRQPEQMNDVRQPFDKNKFNFTKISAEEILFKFWEKTKASYVHTVIVNASPINQYHSLLCPSMYEMLPQVVTLESLQLVLDIYTIAGDRDLRIAFNSLCALASVNHLHYHLMIERKNLPVETVECKHIKGPVYMTEGHPAPAFCFDASSNSAAENIYKLINYFLNKCIAHNIFITRGCPLNGGSGEITRVFIWPRKSTAGAKQLSAFNVAALEFSGFFAVYTTEDFKNLEAQDLERELMKWRLDNLDQLCKEIEVLF